MSDTIVLVRQDGSRTALALDTSPPEIIGAGGYHAAYQDERYSFELYGESFVSECWVRLSVGSVSLRMRQGRIVGVPDALRLDPEDDMSAYPFRLQYGLAGISVSLSRRTRDETVLFSELAAVAVSERKTDIEESVREMLEQIRAHSRGLMTSGGRSGRMDEASLMRVIAASLKRELPYFANGARTRTATERRVDSFDRVRRIGGDELSFVASHPEHLEPAAGSVGIAAFGRRFMPTRTLVDTPSISRDTPENRAVVAFVNTLRARAAERCSEARRDAEAASSADVSIVDGETLMPGTYLSTELIRSVASDSAREAEREFAVIEDVFTELFRDYSLALLAVDAALTAPPPLSLVFLEVAHYRAVYELMELWLRSDRRAVSSRAGISGFDLPSADKIYERFCMLEICDVLESLGYAEDTASRRSYDYMAGKTVADAPPNVFKFTARGADVVLYVQPKIWSTRVARDIGLELFRTDGSSYCVPDFVLKCEAGGAVRYAVMDAKWRPRSALLDFDSGGLADVVYKYLFSVADAATGRSVDALWVLQGKDSDDTTLYRHRSSAMSKMMPRNFFFAHGIVALTPRTGSSDLALVMREFLG